MKSFSKFISAAIALALVAGSASSCVIRLNTKNFNYKAVKAEGALVTRTVVPQGSFSRISMAGSFDTEIIQTDGETKIEVTTYESIQDYFKAKVSNSTLGLSFHSDTVNSFELKDTRVVVYVNDLSGVSLAGSGDLKVPSLNTEGNFSVSLAGSGDMAVSSLTCADLEISLAGSGDVSVTGISCNDLKATVAGSGDIVLGGNAAGNAKYSVAGSGDISAKGLKAGNVSASKAGSGNISY